MAYVPVSGNDARLRSGTNPMPEINKWEIVKKTTSIKVITFETVADADNNLYPTIVLKGTSESTVTFSGFINTDATGATDGGVPGIRNGLIITMDFILVKATPWGFRGISVFIEQYTVGTGIGTEAATFSASGVVVGAPGVTH